MNRAQSIKRKNRQSDIFIFVFFMFLTMLCGVILGFAGYQAGLFDTVLFSASMTRTAVAENNASCQLLIQKAMEASDEYCSSIDSNKACYGNNTLKADLVAGAADPFTERGDVVDVEKLQRIVASPLMPDSGEWGIAVLKVLANLPRSLPGQTITMVVFGNTTLDNPGGNLESFFFSSELGQIQCEKVPDDGIMISVPEGEGVSFMVNGSELTLTGDASITAQKNGKMEVNLYEGGGRIVSGGQEQYFGAGQQVSVQLGGENGTESIGVPSEPVSISQDDLDTACLLTGQYCRQDQITPVPGDQAQQLLQEELGITPTAPPISPTLTSQPSSTFATTPTLLILPSKTSTRVATSTRPPTAVVTRTRTTAPTKTSVPGGGSTLTPSRTPTRTFTPTITNTRTPSVTPGGPSLTPSRTFTATLTRTPTLTSTLTATITNTATQTFTSTVTATDTQTFTPTFTVTAADTPSYTATNTMGPTCGNVAGGSLTNPNANELQMNITNANSGTIRLDSLHIEWVNSPSNQKINKIFLNGIEIWSGNENNSPGDYPSEHSWSGSATDRDIAPGTVALLFQFDQNMAAGNTVEPTFDIGCSISSSN